MVSSGDAAGLFMVSTNKPRKPPIQQKLIKKNAAAIAVAP
jgi:hypothetical protein